MNAIRSVRDTLQGPMTLDDLWRWAKIVAMVASAILGWQHIVKQVDTLAQQTTRIERYLSSQDAHYWEKVKAQGPE